jgi:hypothetical protein
VWDGNAGIPLNRYHRRKWRNSKRFSAANGLTFGRAIDHTMDNA